MEKKLFYLFLLILFLSNCQRISENTSKFQHDLSVGPKPWTSESFEATEQDFTFAIISDLSGGERPGVYSTAVGQLNQLDPTFVLSVGDLIDGGTEDTKGLGVLEQALKDRPYTVINGHFHSFSHRSRQGRDYLILGTTGGSQNKLDSMAFDHLTLVRMSDQPIITPIKMDGILDQTGQVPWIKDWIIKE